MLSGVFETSDIFAIAVAAFFALWILLPERGEQAAHTPSPRETWGLRTAPSWIRIAVVVLAINLVLQVLLGEDGRVRDLSKVAYGSALLLGVALA